VLRRLENPIIKSFVIFNSYYPLNIIRVLKSGTMRLTEYVTGIGR